MVVHARIHSPCGGCEKDYRTCFLMATLHTGLIWNMGPCHWYITTCIGYRRILTCVKNIEYLPLTINVQCEKLSLLLTYIYWKLLQTSLFDIFWTHLVQQIICHSLHGSLMNISNTEKHYTFQRQIVPITPLSLEWYVRRLLCCSWCIDPR